MDVTRRTEGGRRERVTDADPAAAGGPAPDGSREPDRPRVDPTGADRFVSETRELGVLFGAVLAPPLAFLVNLQVAYTAVTLDCQDAHPWVHVSSAATLVAAAAAGFLAWRVWSRRGRGWPGDGGSVSTRSRFLAVTGMLGSGLFSLLILAQWAAVLFLGPCERI